MQSQIFTGEESINHHHVNVGRALPTKSNWTLVSFFGLSKLDPRCPAVAAGEWHRESQAKSLRLSASVLCGARWGGVERQLEP